MWSSFADNEQEAPLDWVALFYIGTVILGMTEAGFWRCSLRKLHALYSFHTSLAQQKAKRQEVSMYG